ncbi:MAG TPA: hypothetical protein VJR58_10185 [Vineibacter sp.]|nr:hypothetical protein [Vineibacter sp.]
MNHTPGRAVDIKRTADGFVVTIDGTHQQICADIAAVIACVNAVLPPTGRPRSASVDGAAAAAAAGPDDGK